MQATGNYIFLNGETYYLISHCDAMSPFFISVASDTDLWMYIASTGGLTCGRRNPEQALFPYYTDDKVTEGAAFTGPKTLIRLAAKGGVAWEPFSDRYLGVYTIERSIAKSVTGNRLCFIESNKDLGLTFLYEWAPANQWGWVRQVRLINDSDSPVQIDIIDGLQNVLPAAVEQKTQNVFSTLVDAYKRTELLPSCSSLIATAFRMEAVLVDRAEPSESLRCNIVYTLGLDQAVSMTSSRQLDAFRRGDKVVAEPISRGVRGASLHSFSLLLAPKQDKQWYQVADVALDIAQVKERAALLSKPNAAEILRDAISLTTDHLRAIVGQNDGIQHTADQALNARHFANTLFNTMRGGFYCDNYRIDTAAFARHIAIFNSALSAQYAPFLATLAPEMDYLALEQRILDCQDHQLHRLFLEYLPLTFSRRHGDPSRPWNLFDIRVHDADGNHIIAYQGNWRDIFQNWEALSLSYPLFTNGIIAKFLNATTLDGYNPYKVTSEGIDWEVIEPENPWSNIGYWGDHQIIYLCRLLELSYAHDPKSLLSLLSNREFASANVPYRFKSYAQIVQDPKNTILFDDDLHRHIFSILPTYGQDARLVLGKDNQPFLVTMTEKLLITLLTKLSNFVPDAGIWMNTLRPEWNDANNALVGNGASMVTLYYIRRFVVFLRDIYSRTDATYAISAEVVQFLYGILNAIVAYPATDASADAARRLFVDAVGLAGEKYRACAYQGFSGAKLELEASHIVLFLDRTLALIDSSIAANRREDGLFHAYNLISFAPQSLQVSHLYEMLEGQVAILSSHYLDTTSACALLDSMRMSSLYRPDQRSYMLYPNKALPAFFAKNTLTPEQVSTPLVQTLLQTPVLVQDIDGEVHFHASLRNAACLHPMLDALSLSEADKAAALDLYEQVFHHHSFTGRSGTFYKYEGLGSIYWHMVSKLLLAVGEVIAAADATDPNLPFLQRHYDAIKEGIGAHKSPDQYGSFPFDAYSHTPMLQDATLAKDGILGGVQQPGMTGQVKEDILSRFAELGLCVVEGAIRIQPRLIYVSEFENGQLDFTYCGTRFVYCMTDASADSLPAVSKVELTLSSGETIACDDATIAPSYAQSIFARSGAVSQVLVRF